MNLRQILTDNPQITATEALLAAKEKRSLLGRSKRWVYQPDAMVPPWIAPLAHDRLPSTSLFVKTLDGITEVKPGEWISRVKGGICAQIVRATDAA